MVSLPRSEKPMNSVGPEPAVLVEDAAPQLSPGDIRMGTPDVRAIPIEEIVLGPNIRLNHSESDQERLKASIAIAGILCPLMVRPTPAGHFEIINGFGRFQAAKDLGLPTVPCIVQQGAWDESKRLQCQFHENAFRSDLDPLSIALAMRAAKQDLHLKQEAMAKVFGTSQSRISEYMSLLKLPKDQQQQLRDGTLGLKKALEIFRAKKRPVAASHPSTPQPSIRVNGRKLDLSKSLVVPMDNSTVIIAGDGKSPMTNAVAIKVLRKIISSLRKQQVEDAEDDAEVNEAMNEFANDVFGQ